MIVLFLDVFGDLGWFWAILGGFGDWCDVRGAIASGDTWTCLVVHGGGFGQFWIFAMCDV